MPGVQPTLFGETFNPLNEWLGARFLASPVSHTRDAHRGRKWRDAFRASRLGL